LVWVRPGPFAQEESDCVGAREAQQAVESGEIMELPDAARRAGLERKFIGQQARLCNVDGSPHWVDRCAFWSLKTTPTSTGSSRTR
jgi:hypothetical protein